MQIQKIEAGIRTCQQCHVAHKDPKLPYEGRKLCNACSPAGHLTPEMIDILRPFMQHRNMGWKQLALQMRRYNMSFCTLVNHVKTHGLNCAMCHEVIYGSFSIDHDHTCCPKVTTCGKCTRGIVCQRCNVLLAGYDFYKNNPQVINSYMVNYRKQREKFLVR